MKYLIGTPGQLTRLMLETNSEGRANINKRDGEVVLPTETHDPTKQYRIWGNGESFTAEDIPT